MWLLALIFYQVAFAESEVSPTTKRDWVELDAGRGFVGKATDILGSGMGRVFTTQWLDMRLRPFPDFQMEAVGLHLGLHSSDDVTKNTACRSVPEIAGRRFCSSSSADNNNGAHFLAVYAGIQAEFVELLTLEPRPLQIYLGAGAAFIQAVEIAPMLVPYSSIELGYSLEREIQARAGMYLSVPRESSLGLAMPEVTLEYHF